AAPGPTSCPPRLPCGRPSSASWRRPSTRTPSWTPRCGASPSWPTPSATPKRRESSDGPPQHRREDRTHAGDQPAARPRARDHLDARHHPGRRRRLRPAAQGHDAGGVDAAAPPRRAGRPPHRADAAAHPPLPGTGPVADAQEGGQPMSEITPKTPVPATPPTPENVAEMLTAGDNDYHDGNNWKPGLHAEGNVLHIRITLPSACRPGFQLLPSW